MASTTAAGEPVASMQTSAPRPPVSAITHAARSSGACSSTFSVAAAPTARAAASLVSGAPGRAERYVRALDGVNRRRERAAACHEARGLHAFEPDAARARLQVNLLGPAARERVRETVGDAVDLARGAARRGLGDEAVPAGVAGAVNVEEGDAVALAQTPAVNV